jgi:hypothetical protein
MKKIYIFFLILLLASCQSVQEQKISNEESELETSLKKELRWAAQNGDVAKVKELIASGVDVDSLVGDEHTPSRRGSQYESYAVDLGYRKP